MESRSLFALITFFGTFFLLPFSPTPAVAEDNNGAFVDGAGFTLYGTESIKGSGSDKVEQDPVCDRSRRPKIFKVEPDEAKPGQKVTIKGENFGTKECFHGVAFSAAGPAKIDYSFVNETTIQATVPDVRPGMSFIDIIAGGAAAASAAALASRSRRLISRCFALAALLARRCAITAAFSSSASVHRPSVTGF